MDINELSGWGISQQIAEIVENGFTFDEETGEVFFTTDDLEALQEALDNKLESLAGIYQMYVSKGEALKIRSKDIADRAKSFEKKADRIKEYIDALMKANGKDDKPLEIGDKKLSYRKMKVSIYKRRYNYFVRRGYCVSKLCFLRQMYWFIRACFKVDKVLREKYKGLYNLYVRILINSITDLISYKLSSLK